MNIGDWILITNIVVTSGITIFLQIKQKRENRKEYLDKKLMELERISLDYPYMEDVNYTCQWDKYKDKYTKGMLSPSECDKLLKYDVYTEMLFNLLSETYTFYESKNLLYSKFHRVQKTERRMLNHIAFKPWIRRHTQC